MLNHQQHQKEVIDTIERQIAENSLQFTTVSPVEDYTNDPRLCLTSVHFPKESLLTKISETIIKPLQNIQPTYYYYPKDYLHMTIKNIRVINDPPHFSQDDVTKAKTIFSQVIPQHKKFFVYFYRLLLFPNNLALIGTSDNELDKIILDLDTKLHQAGIPDDKHYANSRYFFSNMTLARFSNPSEEFKKRVTQLSQILSITSYQVDSVSLVVGNAVFNSKKIIDTWSLK